MEEPIKWDDDTWTLHASESKSIDNLADTLEYYSNILLCRNIVIALSSKTISEKRFILCINTIEKIIVNHLHILLVSNGLEIILKRMNIII